MHLFMVVLLLLASLVSGAETLPVGTEANFFSASGFVETSECPLETPMNETRCIMDTSELQCNDMTLEFCACPINYFCHFDILSVCYFTCQHMLAPETAAQDFDMGMLRGSEVPGFSDETAEE